MRSDGSSTNIPEEVERWFEKDLIDEAQYKRIRERYTSNIWDSIEYFFEMGLINKDQYKRLKLRYIPDEIEKWHNEGIITDSQVETFRKGYYKNIDDVLEEFERIGDIEIEQRSMIGSLYGIDQISADHEYPLIPEPEIEQIIPGPADQQVPMMEEPEQDKLWPDDYGYEMKPDEFIEQEPLKKVKREEKSPKIEKVIELPPPKKVSTVKRSMKNEVKKESFFKFNQLVFFITGTVLFLLAVFAAVVYSWEYLSNIGRGASFLILSAMVLISGVILHSKKFNKYLEVVTYNASFILFSVGIIFLISGSRDDEVMMQGVILLSLLIPMMATFIGYHFRYISITVLAGLGYMIAVVNSFIMWPEGSMVANSILFTLSIAILVLSRGGLRQLRKIVPMEWAERYKGDRVQERAFSYTMITIAVTSFLVSQSILVIDNGPGTMMGFLLSISGLLLLLALYGVTINDKLAGIKIIVYYTLVFNAVIQFGLLNDQGLFGGSIAGLSLVVPFFFGSILWSKFTDPSKDDLVVLQVIQWSSAIGTCFFILGTEPIPPLDIHSHFAILLGLFSIVSLVLTRIVRNPGIYVFSLFVLLSTGTYFGFMKSDIALFIILAAPFIYSLYFKGKNERKIFEAPFILFLVLNFALMWLGPLEPYGGFESFIEPVAEWWKGIITLVFSLVVFYWGLGSGIRPRFWVGSIIFLFSTWMAMMGQGDLFVIVFFLITTGPILFRKMSLIPKGMDLSDTEEELFQNLMLLAGALLFISVWLTPVFAPIKETSLDWSWWKTIVSVLFSIIYLSWSVISFRKLHFLAGSLFMATAALFNTVYRSEVFALVLILLPILVVILRRTERIKERISRVNIQVYMVIISFLLVLAFIMVLAIKPYHPILNIDYNSWKDLMWLKSGISFLLTLTVLVFGIHDRSKYYYLLGTALFVTNSVILAVFYSELFVLPVLLLPAILFLVEDHRGILGRPRSLGVYLVRFQYRYSMLLRGIDPGKREKLKDMPNFWLYRQLFPFFLLPLSVVLFFRPFYPLFELSFDIMYWKYVIALILALPIFIQSGRSRLPVPAFVSTIILVSWTVIVSVLRIELMAFVIVAFPVIIHLIGKMEGPIKGSDFQKVFHVLYVIPYLLGYSILWLTPIEPVIDLDIGSSQHLLFKGLITLGYGSLVLVWGYSFEKRIGLVLGIFLTSISLLFLSIVFFEPLVFVFMLIIPTIRWLSKRSGMIPRSDVMNDLISKIIPFNNIFILFGFMILFVPAIYPVIDLPIYGQTFWIYRGIILMVYSGSVLAYGLYKSNDRLTIMNGIFMSSITIMALSAILLSEFIFLLFLLLYLIYLWKEKAIDEDRENISPVLIYRSLVISMMIGFILLWLNPFRSFYHLPVSTTGYWMMKCFLGAIFSIGYYAWGVYRKEISTTIISLIFLTITILTFGITTLSIAHIAVIGVIYLMGSASERIEWDSLKFGIHPLRVFQNLYLLVTFLAFILLWVPEVYPIISIEPWSTGHFLFRALLTTTFSGIMMTYCIYGDRPFHFIISNMFILLTSFIMMITVSEPFALMIYLVPLSLLVLQNMSPRKGFDKAASGVSGFFKSITGRTHDDEEVSSGSLFEEFKHIILAVTVVFFLVLFIMVWTGPVKALFHLEGTGHLWFVSGTMLCFALVPLFWGLKGTLRAHVLMGVLYIVINGWVIFLAQMKGLGVVVSLFFTALMFIAGGLYFVWASKRQSSEPEK